jgi:phosphatidylinositol alpha-1,6-mannosyltransferase
VIAGKGNLVPKLQLQAAHLGIQDAVVFTGSVAEEDMSSMYSYADIFSLVTEAGKGMGEGLPLTPLEAMACRTPIIVGNQDGSREAVFAEENGYVIDPQDLQKHAKVILELLQDNDAREFMSKNAESLARKHFSFDHFREKHRHFYKSMHVNAINA